MQAGAVEKLQTEDEYIYDENEFPDAKESDNGGRLVGARAASTKDYPFLVAFSMFVDGSTFSMHCTGSLITPTYIVSAAHCNSYIMQQPGNRTKRREECVRNTKEGKSTESYLKDHTLKIWCKWIVDESSNDDPIALEIKSEPKAKAWLGEDNINKADAEGDNSAKMIDIIRHIRHMKAYKGFGKYGAYGGYDITLFEIEKPFNNYQPACLPSPTFDDIRRDQQDSIIAGYGYYHRDADTCETNKYGKMKYHYCNKGNGYGSDACDTDSPPPIDDECKSFFDDPNTPNSIPPGVEEIKLEGVSDNATKYCYPSENPESKSFGWCWTGGNYYDRNEILHDEDESWGFCGKDCYLNETVENYGILRQKHNVSILEKDLCESFLQSSLLPNTKVKPLILCIAKKEHFKEEVWRKDGEGYKRVVVLNKRPHRYGLEEYVASVGTCKGDSGGPVFVRERNHFVLTGESSYS